MNSSPPPAVVLDTNVLLDWMVFRDPRVRALSHALEQGGMAWWATAAMRAEFSHMLGHRSLERWKPECERALACFDSLAKMKDSSPPAPWRCSDPDDQCFVDLALDVDAGWLLTRDRALLKLARRAAGRGLIVVPPERWQPP